MDRPQDQVCAVCVPRTRACGEPGGAISSVAIDLAGPVGPPRAWDLRLSALPGSSADTVRRGVVERPERGSLHCVCMCVSEGGGFRDGWRGCVSTVASTVTVKTLQGKAAADRRNHATGCCGSA